MAVGVGGWGGGGMGQGVAVKQPMVKSCQAGDNNVVYQQWATRDAVHVTLPQTPPLD